MHQMIPDILIGNCAFLDEMPENTYVEACYTPGGTGAIRNAISGYTKPGDKILTSDWHWNPYNLVAKELGREVATYTLFDENNKFNAPSFGEKLEEILSVQDEIVIIINTPAHNPTGYTFTEEDWNQVLETVSAYSDKSPFLPSVTIYGTPPTLVATIGSPHAIASTNAMP